MSTAVVLLMLSSLPRPGFPADPLVLPTAHASTARPSLPDAPALAPKESVELDLSLAGDVTRPAPAPAPRPAFQLRPLPINPELRAILDLTP